MSAPAMGTSKTAHTDSSHKKKKGPGTLATAYLVIYNVVMTAGWLVIAVGLVRAYLARGSYHGLYYSIEKPLKYFQTGINLFTQHLKCFEGIVPSSVVLTGFQVMSRVFLTWAVTHSVREVKLLRDYCLAFIWLKSIFYVLRSSNFHRYTFFFVLYPMGVAGELLTIYAALPYVQKTGLYSITLPNNYNFSFDYHTFLILIMHHVFSKLFPQLYFHMIRQRKKVLGHVEEYSKVE
uniref:Very-long-chain (3R)-3-hydroxyacyl-CoA dehydratase n=2 Tax=Cyprinus carpio TaxID=7962 RepID=A0A8C2J2G6_CYPCA